MSSARRLVAVGGALVVAGTATAATVPSPPANATVFARQLGNDALALAVVPRASGVDLRATVLGRQGNGVTGLRVTFTVDGLKTAAAPCGAGCYRATFAAKTPRTVDVGVAGHTKAPWRVTLPAAWPPRDGSALVTRAATTWRALRSLTFDERLMSGINIGVRSTWRAQAPDRVAYQVRGGWAGIVIGGRRWDRAPGATRWQTSAQTRLHQPVPPWGAVVDAHVLGPVAHDGRRATRVSFFDPVSHAWFTIVVDDSNHRTLQLDMVTNAHFMHDVFRAFDSTPPIVPPR
ncbi:MAG TPA: hypothetical protein VFJ78_03875 [Gaiellaceae bacterium]|nr:hypothetical protein [Gaiellaceae bacterium]